MSDLKYTKAHEWLVFEGELVTVGLTDFAQQQLGDVVFVELPEQGQAFKEGDEAAVIESVKAAGEIVVPLDGDIVEVNAALSEDPELVNREPESEGWFFKMRVAESAELPELLTGEQYQALIAE